MIADPKTTPPHESSHAVEGIVAQVFNGIATPANPPVKVRVDRRWLIIESASTEAPPTQIGSPGLWKMATFHDERKPVFEIPCWAFDEDQDTLLVGDEQCPTREAFVAWAATTAFSRLQDQWTPPATGNISSWLPENGLTVQAGGSVRQGELIREPSCWALRFPVLTGIPDDLPESRVAALHLLMEDAMNRWTMVRVGIEADTREMIAEVNLTGAPHSQSLFEAALHGLRHAVIGLIPTAEIVNDPSVTLQSLDLNFQDEHCKP